MTPDPSLTDEALGALLRRARMALPDAPAPLVQDALALWTQAAAAPAQAAPVHSLGDRLRGGVADRLAAALGGLQHVAAVLQFDSWATAPLAAGMRGTGAAPRQLLFSALGRDIDLRIAPGTGNLYSVDGQLLGPDDRCAVALSADAGGPPLHRAEVDALGEFHFQGIGAGCWHLSLTLPDQVIDLPSIDLGSRQA